MGGLRGIGVSPGAVAGPLIRMATRPAAGSAPPPAVEMPAVEVDVHGENAAARAALEAVAAELETRGTRAGGDAAEVLAAQAMIARDPGLADLVTTRVKAGWLAPAALADAFAHYRGILAGAGEYLAARVADLDDIRDRALAVLSGRAVPGVPHPGHPYVLAAVDLAPADTATLDPAEVIAIVTEEGGPTSHTAILAKSLGIPAVVACAGIASLADATVVLVDGGTGVVDVEPGAEALARAQAREDARRAALAAGTGPGRTSDGHGVDLLVNLGGAEDLTVIGAVGPAGVGLLRTEFLFLDRPDEPGLAEQREAYLRVFAAFGGRKVVVRTLDAGADKPLRFVTAPDEPNPALGVRGLRTARRAPGLLDRQLAAIAAAAEGSEAKVWVMAPMVSTPAEAAAFRARARAAGLAVAGVMVEVPAAALRASAVAAACDFLSIGTNDLAQYAFAADRMAGGLADLLDPWQPALLDLVRLAADGAGAAGKPVGVCGEAASDPLLALVLVGLGVTSLSMAPIALPAVRASLARHTLAHCRRLAAAALAAPDGQGARYAVAALAADQERVAAG
ncbi:phosphoenolpyruvate--protein phosphotransferase [Parafrankia soli]|uniref:Phosphoenolpyruvate-protein phosphotransferase n=1 Tax=Parafrankia soli TaxID=2599596 RepID=A0A1S1PEV3_9ACTN|nr:phosphoenolpyruvate--protein phosphotransferase [Parafrankia soli]